MRPSINPQIHNEAGFLTFDRVSHIPETVTHTIVGASHNPDDVTQSDEGNSVILVGDRQIPVRDTVIPGEDSHILATVAQTLDGDSHQRRTRT